MDERYEKYFTFIITIIGIGIIVYSVICRHYGLWAKEYFSLMENIGTAFLIPGLFVWLQNAITRIVRVNRPLISEYLSMMKSNLNMMGISLYDVHTDERREYIREYILKVFGKKSHRPLNFRFLLMDPNSKFLKQRAEMEGEDPEKELKRLRAEIEETITQLKDLKKLALNDKKVKWEIRLYDAMPTHSLIWVDEIMYVGPYFRKRPGYTTLSVKISSNEDAYFQLKDDFEKLWKEAKPVEG